MAAPMENPPPYSVHPPPVPQQPEVTTEPGPVVIKQMVGPVPTYITCPWCHQDMVTSIIKKATMRTHFLAVLLCVLECWPCVCVPYCMDSCLNCDHYCTNCGHFIGTYIR